MTIITTKREYQREISFDDEEYAIRYYDQFSENESEYLRDMDQNGLYEREIQDYPCYEEGGDEWEEEARRQIEECDEYEVQNYYENSDDEDECRGYNGREEEFYENTGNYVSEDERSIGDRYEEFESESNDHQLHCD